VALATILSQRVMGSRVVDLWLIGPAAARYKRQIASRLPGCERALDMAWGVLLHRCTHEGGHGAVTATPVLRYRLVRNPDSGAGRQPPDTRLPILKRRSSCWWVLIRQRANAPRKRAVGCSIGEESAALRGLRGPYAAHGFYFGYRWEGSGRKFCRTGFLRREKAEDFPPVLFPRRKLASLLRFVMPTLTGSRG